MPVPDFSPEELTILQLLSEGNRTSEIAKRLSRSYRSVVESISVMKAKTGKSDVTELLKYYKTITGTD